MNDLISSIEKALEQELYYPAFMSALCLPDICGYISDPTNDSVGDRYQVWFEKYMPESYRNILSGKEAYGLRCVVLHNGELSLKQYSVRNKNVILDKFEVFEKGIHLLRVENVKVDGVVLPSMVRLSSKAYIEDIVAGVKAWERDTGKSIGQYDEMFAIEENGDIFTI